VGNKDEGIKSKRKRMMKIRSSKVEGERWMPLWGGRDEKAYGVGEGTTNGMGGIKAERKDKRARPGSKIIKMYRKGGNRPAGYIVKKDEVGGERGKRRRNGREGMIKGILKGIIVSVALCSVGPSKDEGEGEKV